MNFSDAPPPNATPIEIVHAEMLPLVKALEQLAHEQREVGQEQFFARIREALEAAEEPDDLAGPFFELSTSAFRGFAFSGPASLLLDRVLASASRLSMLLSADSQTPH